MNAYAEEKYGVKMMFLKGSMNDLKRNLQALEEACPCISYLEGMHSVLEWDVEKICERYEKELNRHSLAELAKKKLTTEELEALCGK